MGKVACGRSCRAGNALKKDKGEIANKAALIRAKGQAVAHKKPQDSTYCQAGVAVHAGGEHIARAHKATVEKGQGRGHHENQSGADKYEGVVYRVHGTLPYNLKFKIQMAIRGKIANPYLSLLKHRVCQNASFFFVDAKSS